jgi:hypothetical protein
MKKIIVYLLSVSIAFSAVAQKKQYDSVAILIVDKMSDVISSMQSCSFKLVAANDVADTSNILVKHFTNYDVYMNGPDKMLIDADGDKGHRLILYNGRELAYYSFDEHNYGVVKAPPTIIQTIDSMHTNYDWEFPAADFFYPAFTDDLLENVDELRYLGNETISGKEYFHLLAIGKNLNFQFWINNDAYSLPARFVITYKNQPGQPQYQATFSDWQVNPSLPLAMFDFQPPPNAKKIRLMSKHDR